MNIQIRVLAAQARKELAGTAAQVKAVDKAAAGAGRGGMASLTKSLNPKHMVAFGSSTQWTGRQLARNFTAPLLLAGAAAAKFALDNEGAFVRIKKVYGDGSDAMKELSERELPALKRAFEALSNQYGVQQTEVLKIAGDWAAAGASGLDLAKSVEITMKTMVLGEMEAAKATEALIAIQAQYGFGTEELIDTIETLNMVENQTGISLTGLVDGMSRAAGVARSSGIDVRHLAAMMAALVPAAGSAANAGNALKTIISRVMSPTQEAAQVMTEMGIQLDQTSWKSKNAQQRLVYLAEEYRKLGEGVSQNSKAVDENGEVLAENVSAQQAVASTVIASRWQINRFDVLMRALTNDTSYFNRALESTADPARNAQQAIDELNAVLQSSPRRLKQMGVILQNSLANIIQPLIPSIIALAAVIAKAARGFSELNPFTQKFIMVGLALLALLGPILIFFGSLVTAIGVLAPIVLLLLKPFSLLGKLIWAVAAGPFMLFAKGASGLGKAVGGAAKGFPIMFAKLKQFIALSTYAGGLQGLVARAITRAWVFARTAVVLNLLAIRVVFVGTLTRMVTMAAGWFAANMMSTFSATFVALWQGVALRMSGMLATMSARFASMRLIAALTFASMLTSARMGMTRMLAVVAAGMVAMLMPFYRWGIASTGIVAVTMARISALFLAAQLRWYAIWLANGSRIVALQAAIWSAVIATHTWMAVRITAITAAVAARITLWHAAAATAIATKWAALGAWWTVTTAALGAKIVALHAAIATKMLTIWALFGARWTALQLAIAARGALIWTAAVLAMTNPALLLARLKMLALAMWSIVPTIRAAALAIATAFTGPIGLAVLAAGALFFVFRDQIKQVFNNIREIIKGTTGGINDAVNKLAWPWMALSGFIIRSFNKLPEGIKGALLAVFRLVNIAAQKVYDALQWMNPFARHSPSLVESTEAGMGRVAAAYTTAGRTTSGVISRARAQLASFRKAMDQMGTGEFAKERKDIAEANPASLGSFDSLAGNLGPLRGLLASIGASVAAQEAVVNRWEGALDRANANLDEQQKKLDSLKMRLQGLTDLYDAAQQRMQDFASAPIRGMGAMEDKIFANEMAQKRLQLAMLDWEDQNGPLDDYKNKLASLRGEIESLRGTQSDLRAAGAGSEITSTYDNMIKEMEGAHQALTAQANAGVNTEGPEGMRLEMERLNKEAERLSLQQALAFDPLVRQIERAADGSRELDFATIINGIDRERAAMAALQPQIDAATAAVNRQEVAVTSAQAARDAASDRLDIEKDKLSALNDSYSEVESTIRDVESALRDMGSAASTALSSVPAEYVSPGLQNFRDAAGGSFDDPGMNKLIGQRGENPFDESGLIDDFTKNSAASLEGAFEGMDLMGPFKRAWKKVEDWFKDYIVPFGQPLVDAWHAIVGSVNWGAPFDDLFKNDKVQGFAEKLEVTWFRIRSGIEGFIDGARAVWELFWPDIKRVFDKLVEGGREAFNKIGAELAKFGPMLGPMLSALKNFLTIVGGIILFIGKLIFSVLGHVIGPVINLIVGIITNAIQIIRGLIQIVVGIFTLDFAMMAKGVGNIFGGMFGLIWSIIKGAVGVIWGVVKGLVGGIIGFFKWLYDVLVGHSIVPDLINGIITVFGWLANLAAWVFENVLRPIFDFFVRVGGWVLDKVMWLVSAVWDSIKFWFNVARWVFDNVLRPVFDFFVKVAAWVIDKVMWLVGSVWDGIKIWISIAKWVFDNVLRPIFDFFVKVAAWIWDKVLWLGDRIWEGFGKLKALADWVWNNIVMPIFGVFGWLWDNGIKPLLNRMLRGFANIFNSVGEAIARGVNVGISAINGLIGALNWVGSNVPGLSFQIGAVGTIGWSHWNPPQFAAGGAIPSSQVGAGFKTDGPRAIVGEGRAAYPEYVIPTDPRYRTRAKSLLFSAAGDLGGDVPQFAWGGVLPAAKDAWGAVSGAISSGASTLRRGAVTAGMAPGLLAFDQTIGRMSDKPPPLKETIMRAKNDVYNWMKGVENAVPDFVPEPPSAAVGGSSNGLLPIMAAARSYTQRNYGINNIGGYSYRKIAGTNTLSDHALGKALDIMTSNVELGTRIANDFAFGSAHRLFNIENTIWRQAISSKGGPFRRMGDRGSPTQNHMDHIHVDTFKKGGMLPSVPSLANGALIRRRTGGVLARIGEGRTDEAVVPLPNGLRNLGEGGSKKEVHFHSPSLVFPNIRNAEDAEAFVRNLNDLAGG